MNIVSGLLQTDRLISAFGTGDHRVDPSTCNHSRFWDKHFPTTGTCLDCGGEIVLGKWVLTNPADPVLLTDATLSDERIRYNAFWKVS